MDAAVEVTIKRLIPQELHFLINPTPPQPVNTSKKLSDILYRPKDMFKAAEV